MKRQAHNVLPPPVLHGRGLRNFTTAVNWSEERNANGERWCRRTCSFGRPRKAAESWQWQTCKLSLTLSESTTRDGLRPASRTQQAGLRPTY